MRHHQFCSGPKILRAKQLKKERGSRWQVETRRAPFQQPALTLVTDRLRSPTSPLSSGVAEFGKNHSYRPTDQNGTYFLNDPVEINEPQRTFENYYKMRTEHKELEAPQQNFNSYLEVFMDLNVPR